MVRINAVRNKKAGVGYLLKYITKPKPHSCSEDTAYFLELLIGVRRIHTFGIFYNHVAMKRRGYPCPFCTGKLMHRCFDPGPLVPAKSLFWDEAMSLAEKYKNVM